eukprot:6985425-Pyramimonas_sp.AAC.2
MAAMSAHTSAPSPATCPALCPPPVRGVTRSDGCGTSAKRLSSDASTRWPSVDATLCHFDAPAVTLAHPRGHFGGTPLVTLMVHPWSLWRGPAR